MRNSIKSAALALASAGALAATVPAGAATAVSGVFDSAALNAAGEQWNHGRGRHRHHYDGYYGGQNYYDDGGYDGPVWQGRDGRYYCRRSDGTTGLLIGGAVGGLLGREVAGRHGDRTAGLIIGMAGGALIGRAIERNRSSCR